MCRKLLKVKYTCCVMSTYSITGTYSLLTTLCVVDNTLCFRLLMSRLMQSYCTTVGTKLLMMICCSSMGLYVVVYQVGLFNCVPDEVLLKLLHHVVVN
jgi:hypothetical protein